MRWPGRVWVPCRQVPAPGETLCRYHGGKPRPAREKTREELDRLLKRFYKQVSKYEAVIRGLNEEIVRVEKLL
jgi:hypothetical protein